MIRRTGLVAMALAAVLASGGMTYAADGGWKTEIAPYAWLAGVSGDVTIKGVTADVNESFSDISKVLDFGGMLHVESGKDKFSVLFDTAYIKLSDTRTFMRMNMTESITELGAAYRVIGVENGPGLALDILGGGRYWYLKSDITLFGVANQTGRQDWIDPFAGARLRWSFTKNLMLVVRGDVGGFNVGATSSWNAVGTIVYSVSDFFSMAAGYRALNAHYETGEWINKFDYDATMAGPVIGALFSF